MKIFNYELSDWYATEPHVHNPGNHWRHFITNKEFGYVKSIGIRFNGWLDGETDIEKVSWKVDFNGLSHLINHEDLLISFKHKYGKTTYKHNELEQAKKDIDEFIIKKINNIAAFI